MGDDGDAWGDRVSLGLRVARVALQRTVKLCTLLRNEAAPPEKPAVGLCRAVVDDEATVLCRRMRRRGRCWPPAHRQQRRRQRRRGHDRGRCRRRDGGCGHPSSVEALGQRVELEVEVNNFDDTRSEAARASRRDLGGPGLAQRPRQMG